MPSTSCSAPDPVDFKALRRRPMHAFDTVCFYSTRAVQSIIPMPKIAFLISVCRLWLGLLSTCLPGSRWFLVFREVFGNAWSVCWRGRGLSYLEFQSVTLILGTAPAEALERLAGLPSLAYAEGPLTCPGAGFVHPPFPTPARGFPWPGSTARSRHPTTQDP